MASLVSLVLAEPLHSCCALWCGESSGGTEMCRGASGVQEGTHLARVLGCVVTSQGTAQTPALEWAGMGQPHVYSPCTATHVLSCSSQCLLESTAPPSLGSSHSTAWHSTAWRGMGQRGTALYGPALQGWHC